jgi:hypothetical protein
MGNFKLVSCRYKKLNIAEPLYVEEKDISKMRSTIKQFIRDWSKEVKKIWIMNNVN